MSDKAALEAEKATLIAEMQDLQTKFMDMERAGNVTSSEYFTATDGLLKDYRHIYTEKSMRLVAVSHELIGSEA